VLSRKSITWSALPILDPSGRVVIPQQVTLVGGYRSADLLYSDGRLDLWFSQLNLGQGVSQMLEDGGVADGMGQAGVTGDVDQHYWRLLGTVFINGVLRGGTMGMTREVAGLGPTGQVAAGIVSSGAAVEQQRALRTMNTRPTIRVPLGYRMTLILGKERQRRLQRLEAVI
jgi:type IV secretion system protein TrbI